MKNLLPGTGAFRRSPAFRYLFAAQLVSSFGSALTYVVLPFEMYRLTHSTVLVGLLGVVEFVPMLVLAFVGGALADHFERKRLILAAESFMLLVCLMLTWNASQARPALWPLWLAAAMLAGLNALHRPAMEALTPQILPPEEMTAAAAWQSLRGNFSHILGPALAGLVAATYGAKVAFGIDALTYVFSLVMIARMPGIPPHPNGEERLTWASLLEGWRYARERQDLLGTYLIDMNAMFFGMPNALFPALAEQWGVSTLGMLYAAPSVGALLAAATSGWASRVYRHGLAITLAAIVWGLGIIGFGLSTPLWLALFFLALAGAADMVSGVFRMTIWNQTIPGRLRGRMASIEMVSYSSGPYLGNAEAGFAARLFGLQASVVSGGVLCILGAGVLALLLPKFIRYDSRDLVRLTPE